MNHNRHCHRYQTDNAERMPVLDFVHQHYLGVTTRALDLYIRNWCVHTISGHDRLRIYEENASFDMPTNHQAQ